MNPAVAVAAAELDRHRAMFPATSEVQCDCGAWQYLARDGEGWRDAFSRHVAEAMLKIVRQAGQLHEFRLSKVMFRPGTCECACGCGRRATLTFDKHNDRFTLSVESANPIERSPVVLPTPEEVQADWHQAALRDPVTDALRDAIVKQMREAPSTWQKTPRFTIYLDSFNPTANVLRLIMNELEAAGWSVTQSDGWNENWLSIEPKHPVE